MSSPRILILQPMADDGPAYLATWLREHAIAFDVCSVATGDEVPISVGNYHAIAMLGGSMSANDDLPFLHRADALLRDAVAHGRPVVGHCLGGQMLARALGASVTDNVVPEFGWSRVAVAANPQARAWFGEEPAAPAHFMAYQWHFQTFALPDGATLLASNGACAHQAFGFGPHLGMQFHIEVDAEKLGRWCAEAPPPGDPLLAHPTVQDEAAMRADTAQWLAASQRTAARVYARWMANARAANAPS